jgi:hypothetical protein
MRYRTLIKHAWNIGTLLTYHPLLIEKAALNIQNTEHQINA